MKKIQREGVLSITVKQEATDDLYQHFDEIHKHTVWQEECRSWYKNGKLKNRIYLWPGPVSFISSSQTPKIGGGNERKESSRSSPLGEKDYITDKFLLPDNPLPEDYQGTKNRRLCFQIQIRQSICVLGKRNCQGNGDQGRSWVESICS